MNNKELNQALNDLREVSNQVIYLQELAIKNTTSETAIYEINEQTAGTLFNLADAVDCIDKARIAKGIPMLGGIN